MRQITENEFIKITSDKDIVSRVSYEPGGYIQIFYKDDGHKLVFVVQREVFDDETFWVDDETE